MDVGGWSGMASRPQRYFFLVAGVSAFKILSSSVRILVSGFWKNGLSPG